MGKNTTTAMLDLFLDGVAASNAMSLCSAEPTTRTEAATTYMLADVAMAGGDFTKAAGSPSGRKVTMGQKTGVVIDNTGTGNHVALYDGTVLRYVTTATSQAVTAANTMTFNAWAVTLPLPT